MPPPPPSDHRLPLCPFSLPFALPAATLHRRTARFKYQRRLKSDLYHAESCYLYRLIRDLPVRYFEGTPLLAPVLTEALTSFGTKDPGHRDPNDRVRGGVENMHPSLAVRRWESCRSFATQPRTTLSPFQRREREREREILLPAKSEAPLRNHRYASFTRASPRGTRSNRSPFDPMPLCRSIRAIQIAFLETIDVTTINPSRNETGGYTQGLLVSRAPRKSKIRPSPLPRQPRLESDDKRRSRPVEKYRSLLPTNRDPRSFLPPLPLRFPGERDSSKHLFNRPLPEHRSVRVVGEIVFPRGANKFALPPYFGRTSIDAVDLRTVEFD